MRRHAVLFLALGLIALWPAASLAQEADPELEGLLGAPQAARPAPRGGTVTGISNLFNPSIGVAGLLLGAGSDRGPANFGIHEIEVTIRSDIDPYFRVDLFLAVEEQFDVAGLAHGEEEPGAGGGEEEPTVVIEQAVITSTSLPHVTLRFGKFTLPFGKHNVLHRDQFHFITAPAVMQETLGPEGLNEKAIDAAPLLPVPFFSELNLAVFQGDNEPLFHFAEGPDGARPAPDKAKYLAHSKSLFDVTDDSTIEIGLSYLSGANNAGGDALTTAYGADLTFKHRPSIGRGLSALVLQGEWIGATREAEQDLEASGYYLSAQWRVFDYWWVQGRYGEVSIDDVEADAIGKEETKHQDFLIAWVLSEFSVLRLQYSSFDFGGEKVNAWYLQFNFVTGAHPPHQY